MKAIDVAEMIESMAMMQYSRDIRGELALRQWNSIGAMLRELPDPLPIVTVERVPSAALTTQKEPAQVTAQISSDCYVSFRGVGIYLVAVTEDSALVVDVYPEVVNPDMSVGDAMERGMEPALCPIRSGRWRRTAYGCSGRQRCLNQRSCRNHAVLKGRSNACI